MLDVNPKIQNNQINVTSINTPIYLTDIFKKTIGRTEM